MSVQYALHRTLKRVSCWQICSTPASAGRRRRGASNIRQYYTCGYITNPYYVSNFYNGTSANDRAANGVALNPAFAQPYIPRWADENVYVLPGPFNAYLQLPSDFEPGRHLATIYRHRVRSASDYGVAAACELWSMALRAVKILSKARIGTK